MANRLSARRLPSGDHEAAYQRNLGSIGEIRTTCPWRATQTVVPFPARSPRRTKATAVPSGDQRPSCSCSRPFPGCQRKVSDRSPLRRRKSSSRPPAVHCGTESCPSAVRRVVLPLAPSKTQMFPPCVKATRTAGRSARARAGTPEKASWARIIVRIAMDRRTRVGSRREVDRGMRFVSHTYIAGNGLHLAPGNRRAISACKTHWPSAWLHQRFS
jgi:hypothetical protein